MNKLFGTDGIRSKVGIYPLTEDMLYKIGKAVAVYVKKCNSFKRKKQNVAIIKDTRLSGDFIENNLIKGICSEGVDVVKLGIMPSASLAYLVKEKRHDMGIVISASHNDKEDNGLKFFSHKGYKLFPREELEIENILFSENLNSDYSPEDQAQHYSAITQGSVQEKDEKSTYLDFLKKIISDSNIKDFKIVIDCAFGVASVIAPMLFKQLTNNIISLNDSPDGDNINKECGALYPEVISDAVIKNNADCGFSFDGDADRVIACDEKGKILDGDFELAIIGNYLRKYDKLKKNSIVATHMSNMGLDMCVSQWGGKLIKTEIGDKLVLEKMLSSKLNLGGEQSGHIIPLDYASTGDGILAALLILKIMAETQKPLSALSRCMYKFPQVLVNINVARKIPITELVKFSKAVEKNRDKLGTSGRIYVRYSGTESNKLRIMIEAQDQLLIKEMADNLASTAKEEINAKVGC